MASGRIVLSGYYGFGNVGDEAVLAGLVGALGELVPGASPVVLSADPARTRRLHGVTAAPRGLRDAWRALSGARALVSGGGSLLQDVTSARSLVYYLAVMGLAHLRGARVIWAAQGIGPVRRPWLRRWVGWEARRAWAISVRDQASRDTLARWARMDPARIEVVADPAWALPAPQSPAACPKASGEGALRLAVAWRDWPGRVVGCAEAGRALGRALAGVLPAGTSVTVLAFHPGRDLEPCRALASALREGLGAGETQPGAGVRVEPAPEDPRQAVAELARFDAVVGVRLHSLILAGVAGVPFVGVAYDPKVEALVAELGWPLEPLRAHELADPSAWLARLRRLVAEREALRALLARARPAMAQRALEAARPVAALLAREGHGARAGTSSPGTQGSAESLPAPVPVLGLPVHPVDLDQAASALARWLGAAPPADAVRHVVTLNPEMVMRARAEPAFASVVRAADLVVPDGVGVVWAARVLGAATKGRVPGIELAERALETCARRGLPVFLVGGAPPGPGTPGVAEAAAERLRQRADLRDLAVVGTHHGYFVFGSAEEENLLRQIEARAPALLLVGMGSPRQEHFIARHRRRLARCVRVAMGVGGSFDVWAGRTRRAPALFRRLALEWLFRAATEPRRLRRLIALPAYAAAVLAARLGGIMGERPRDGS